MDWKMVLKAVLLGLVVFLFLREDGSTTKDETLKSRPNETVQEREAEPKAGRGEDKEGKVKILYQWLPKICERKVKRGDFVRYHYYGMLEDGSIFDSSYDKGQTYNTRIDSGWLIPGMDQALLGMCVNAHRIVAIPPHLAYGERGTDDIPGGATIFFNFVLLDVSNNDDTVQVITKYLPSDCERLLVKSDFVRYHYDGTLMNGFEFHSSHDNGRSYDAYVGEGWLIQGMDIGLLGACALEKRTIIIPPHLAYGDGGDGKNIPPSAVVQFDVEILDFHNPKDDAVVKTLDLKFGAADDNRDPCPRRVEESDFVRYHYNGTLIDGTLFDSSYSRAETYDTYVGMRRLIAGVDRGILGTCVGETRRITVPPHLGYGESGVDGKIPGSAVIIFDIYLVDVHNPKDDVTFTVVNLPPGNCMRKVQIDDYVTFDYDLELMDGTLIDSSNDYPESFGVYNGRDQIILGLQRGVTGMCVGEIRRIVIPPHVGYGEQGAEGVPGSAVLVYTIKLHKIEDSLPEGVLFAWSEGKSQPKNLLPLVDDDTDGRCSVDELMLYILKEVDAGNATIVPGSRREEIVEDLFQMMDKDGDGFLQEGEMKIPSGIHDTTEKKNDEL